MPFRRAAPAGRFPTKKHEEFLMIYLVIAAAVLATAVVLSPRFSPGLYGKMIFHPVESAFAPPSLVSESQDVFFRTADGVKLHGIFLKNPASDVVFLFSHGNAGTLPGWAAFPDRICQLGASVLVYDYRGYGKSEGKPSLKGIVLDGLAAHDYLVKQAGVSPAKIIPFGWSIGSIPACRTALSRKCGAIVLLGAFASFNKLCYELMPFLRYLVPPFLAFSEKPSNRDALQRLGGSIPTLVVQPEKDELMARHHAESLFAGAKGDKQLLVLPESTHGNITRGMPVLMDALTTLIAKVGSK